jgi:hypothetical protein
MLAAHVRSALIGAILQCFAVISSQYKQQLAKSTIMLLSDGQHKLVHTLCW